MPRNRSSFSRLMEIDVTVPLAVAALVFLGIGFSCGAGAMFRAVAYTFVALLVLGLPLMLLYGHHAELEQFHNLRDEYGGRVRRGWPFRGPSITFRRDDATARVRIIRRYRRNSNRPDDAQVELGWPDPRLRLEIRPQGIVSSLGKLLGARDIEVGRPVFDDRYVVKGNDARRVRALLSKDVQRAMAELPEQEKPVVRIERGRLRVRAQHDPLQSDLTHFTAAALRLFDALRNADGGA